jgi:hypothetical protein
MAKSKLDKYRDLILAVKDQYSYDDIAFMIMKEYGEMVEPATIRNWMIKNKIEKKPVSTAHVKRQAEPVW